MGFFDDVGSVFGNIGSAVGSVFGSVGSAVIGVGDRVITGVSNVGDRVLGIGEKLADVPSAVLGSFSSIIQSPILWIGAGAAVYIFLTYKSK